MLQDITLFLNFLQKTWVKELSFFSYPAQDQSTSVFSLALDLNKKNLNIQMSISQSTEHSV